MTTSDNKPQVANTPPLIVVVGETASGKTSAAIKIAQLVDGEIICADSRTVYKYMDISTAKPTSEEQSLVRHHLIDIVEPNQKFSAADFKRMAEKCIQEISQRGKVPIIVGGTGLYVDAVLYNFQFNDKPNDARRTQLLQMSDEELTTLLHTKNINTSNLNTKNRRHVIRAIERGGETPKNTIMRPSTIVLGIKLDREVLASRIKNRVEQMLQDGFILEVTNIAHDYGWNNEALSGIGFRTVRDYLAGSAVQQEVRDTLIKRDISLAKRQRTWFKRNKNIVWFDDTSALISSAVEFVREFNYNRK